MDRICSFIKSQWKNVLIIILFVSHIFKVFPLSIITFCDKHEGLISSVIGLITLIVAVLALSNWKKELKAEKEYKVYKNVYKFLLSLQEKLQYIKEYYKEMVYRDDEGNLEDEINDKIGQYFKKNLELVQSLELDLMGINDTNDIIPYFLKIFKSYSAKISDRPGYGIQTVCDYETERKWDIDPYEKNFYGDFFCTNDDDTRKELYIKFPKKINEGLNYFREKIQKFFK